MAGMMPSFTSERRNVARREAMAMSHAATTPQPPPRTAPRTQATVGLSSVYKAWNMRAEASAAAWFCLRV